MQNKSLRTTSIGIGFGLCIFLMIAIAMIAWYAIRQQEMMAISLSDQHKTRVLLGESLLSFNSAQIAMLRSRETEDLEFGEEIQVILKRAMESLADTVNHIVFEEIRKRFRELMELYGEFDQLHRNDVAISQEIKRIEPESPEVAKLQALQQEVRQRQAIAIDTIGIIHAEILPTLDHRLVILEEEMRMFSRHLRMIIAVTTTFSVIFGIACCFVITQMLNRPMVSSYHDGFSSPTLPGNQHVIADKLQEVVDLLRE